MTASLVLYLALTAAQIALCMWAAGTALVRGAGHGGNHRAWTLLAAGLLPPITVATALAGTPAYEHWIPIGATLPVLVLAATWANVTTLRHQGFGVRLLHFPVLVLNTSLAGIYTVRVIGDLSSIDLGHWGTAITSGYAELQTRIGHANADDNPIWLHLPMMLPLCLQYRWYHNVVLLGCSTIATGLLALLVLAMPAAYHRVESFRSDPPTEQLLLPPSLGVGAKVPWSDRVFDDDELDTWRQHVLDLGLDHIAIEVTGASFDDPALLAQVEREIGLARDQGLRIVVLTAPSRSYDLVPARDLREMRVSMSRVHWLAAERLKPDLLVLYSGPFGRLARATAKIGTIDQWMDTIRRGATEARQANPAIRLAVAIQNRAPHAEELFRHLRAADSPVDLVGLDAFPDRRTLTEIRDDLQVLRLWIERTPGPRPVAIIETGACPQTIGGELGQWHYLWTMLQFAAGSQVESICIDALSDRDQAHGLIARDGHLRLAYGELRRALHLLRSPAPAGGK